MKTLRVAACLVVFGAIGTSQAGSLFGTDIDFNLYVIDTVTANVTLLGNHGLFLESLAFDGTNLYGATDGGLLYKLNTSTAAPTLVGDTGLGNIEGMDFAGTLLWAMNFANQPTIHQLNPLTGATIQSVQSDTTTGVVRTFAFDLDFTHALMAGDLPNYQTLYSMEATGTTALVGSMGSEGVYAMDFVGADLIGLGSEGRMWQINPATGAKTLIGDTGGHIWLGATVVPEPATLAALGLGLLALARRRRK